MNNTDVFNKGFPDSSYTDLTQIKLEQNQNHLRWGGGVGVRGESPF